MSKPQLRLTFDTGMFGETYTMVVPLSEDVARSYEHIEPEPQEFAVRGGLEYEAIQVIRRRHLRKELFEQAAKNLGALLAERMEDAEGWHDYSRIEPAKKELKQ